MQLIMASIVSVTNITSVLNLNYSTANRLVAAFEEAGILQNTNSASRNRIYTYKQYLDLFKEM